VTSKYIVQIFLDIERPSGIVLTKAWVKYRINFFNSMVLKSLLNQTFKDFEIWLICGRRHKKITSNYKWHKRIKLIYPVGTDVVGDTFTLSPLFEDSVPKLLIKEFGEQDSDYLSITRLDSDDLLHRDAMEEVRERTERILKYNPTSRKRFVFKQYVYWDTVNAWISWQRWDNPPFYVHLFPKKIYQDWKELQQQHFINHRFLDRSGSSLELSSHKVLVTYHTENISRIKRNKSVEAITDFKFKEFKEKGFPFTRDKMEINKILSEFGVGYAQYG
jgi:predicted hydrolase (HD superfamily)